MKLWKGNCTTPDPLGDTWKIPCDDSIYNSQLQQRFLDGGATPQLQKIDNSGIGHWKVPVDKTSNGFHCGTGCVPVKFNTIFLSMPGVTGIADDKTIFRKKLTRNMMEIS